QNGVAAGATIFCCAIASVIFSNKSGDTSAVVRHFGYFEQPRNQLPPLPCRSFIAAPQLGHASLMSIFSSGFFGAGGGSRSLNFSLNSSVIFAVPRQLGYPEQPRNGPRQLFLISIGLPHFSQVRPVST